MTTDLPSNPSDWMPFLNALRAAVEPLAQSNAQTQQHAIQADPEKHRISVAAHSDASKRALYVTLTVTMTVLATVGGAIGGFMYVGQYAVAYNALAFAAGAAAGFGIGRARGPGQ